MKKVFKILGLIAILAVVGFGFTSCGGDDDNGGGDGDTDETITIQNNTGYTLSYGYIKHPKALYWGNDRLTSSTLANGQSRTITLSQPLSENNLYDISFSRSEHSNTGEAYRMYSVAVTNGMTITLNDSHFSASYPGQTVLLLNRVGRNVDSISVWSSDFPSGGAKWFWTGTNSNNNPTSLTIAVRSSVTTAFDLQLESSNPAIKYIKNNVTVSSNMQVMFTTADSEVPLSNTYRPVIVIQNNTGETLEYAYIKVAGTSSWGSDLIGNMNNGASLAFTLDNMLSAQDTYDIKVVGNSNDEFIKNNVKVTDGMVLTFDNSDKS